MTKTARWVILLTLAAMPLAGQAHGQERADAFGIVEGQDRESAKAFRCLEGIYCRLMPVPRPHELLTRYAAIAHKEIGVCSVTGAVDTDGDAAQRFSTLRRHLAAVYGAPAAESGQHALWSATRHFDGIELKRQPEGRGERVTVVFLFPNHEECYILDAPNAFE